MTDRKHLKRRVRERMARTGESYTDALRHVLAARGAAPEGHPAGGHHDAALLHHLLPGHSEAMLAGLGGGIGFMYAVFEYKGHHPMMTIVAQAHPEPMIPAALARAGVAHEVRQTGSARVAERALRETLQAGRTAVCRVGRFSLPWRPGLPFPDPLEVAVVGLDGGDVLVRDARSEPERLPLGEFMTAWSALKKARHHLVSVTGPAGADPAEAVRKAIAATAAGMTGPVLGNAFDVNFGLSGMNRFAGQLGDARGRTGWARRFAHPEAFFTAMTRLHECLESEYTAPGATRPLYAAFLDEAGVLLGGTACARAAGLYREAGGLWSRIAARAAEPFPRYRELAEEKAELLLTEGAGAAGRLREIAATGAYEGPLGEDERSGLLAELAELAARAVRVEEEAAAALRAA
ncbi:BtrH N-terminal domain-containing protein [Planomonospora venezuelensis]|uniref:Butirosin biosynthesis protein H, N-terminal n=1 Tax=Planomonospora venezuelensis TaxID=1999 RepID=A0A841DB33_PLAVE|nr:BtrH N-terminal domain-containing protein [Planomonospora venezuelensis]MBB5966699.1 hypothetical protein [Planomonospora venezuelensis]GIN00330.1 hypothetical protein Pve01_19880 [Planomonospora venezuelensis]